MRPTLALPVLAAALLPFATRAQRVDFKPHIAFPASCTLAVVNAYVQSPGTPLVVQIKNIGTKELTFDLNVTLPVKNKPNFTERIGEKALEGNTVYPHTRSLPLGADPQMAQFTVPLCQSRKP